MPEIQRLMGALCYTRRQSSSPYAELHSPAQWDDVAHEFTRQCCGLLGQVTTPAVITSVFQRFSEDHIGSQAFPAFAHGQECGVS